MRLVLLALLCLALEYRSACGEDLPRGYICPRVERPIVVDGKLDDAAWAGAAWSDDFVDIEGEIQPRPGYRTRVKMAWDQDALYIGAQLEEPHVWATLTEHDAVIFQDNDFEVFIDPDGDNHQYYEVEINALGTEWDLRLVKPYRDGGPALNEWEIPGLRMAVHIDGTLNDPRDVDRGWTVELAFPWKVLGEYAGRPVPPRDGDQWRINFSRVQWLHLVEGKVYKKVAGKREDNWVWTPQGAIDMHRPERWGFVQFTESADATKVPFVCDPAQAVRDRLMDVYHAQARFQKEHGRWGTLEELKLSDAEQEGLELRHTADGYEASVSSVDGTRWRVRQDSRLWREAAER